MTIAQNIKEKLEKIELAAYSLYAGYGMTYSGKYVRFETGVQLTEKKNRLGRVVKAVYQYADDSKLEYTYKEGDGYSLKVAK